MITLIGALGKNIMAIKIILKSFLFSLIILCCNCSTSFPIYDAHILPQGTKQVAFGARYTTEQDGFPNPAAVKVDSAVPKFFNQFKYGSPIVSSITFGMTKRYEVGFGPLGMFQKFAILVPRAYDSPRISDIALTQTYNLGVCLFPNRYYGVEANLGLLLGIPFSKTLSLTTGVLGRECTGELVHTTGDPLKDSLAYWQYSIVTDLKQVVLPISVLYSYTPLTGKLKVIRFCLGTEIPFSLEKTFTLRKAYGQEGDNREDLPFSNNSNLRLIASIGLVL